MGPKSAEKRRPRRTHSLGGCATCRKRHVKCDQVRPLCLTCRAVGVPCEGYSADVRWVPSSLSASNKESGGGKSGNHGTRRHLYTGSITHYPHGSTCIAVSLTRSRTTERSRASMSTALKA